MFDKTEHVSSWLSERRLSNQNTKAISKCEFEAINKQAIKRRSKKEGNNV